MPLAHLTLPTRDVAATVAFLERTLRCARHPGPGNSPVETVWFDIGHGQQMHVFYVEGFAVSPFEHEFGRHVALFHPTADFTALQARLVEAGATIAPPLRPTPFARFFFREPVNGYVFEIIDEDGWRAAASHLDQ
jgi:hypothetical protein